MRHMTLPQDSLWQKKLLQIRKLAQPFITSTVGNGHSTFLPIDNCQIGIKCHQVQIFGEGVVRVQRSSLQVKVSSSTNNRHWRWLQRRNRCSRQIIDRLLILLSLSLIKKTKWWPQGISHLAKWTWESNKCLSSMRTHVRIPWRTLGPLEGLSSR